MREIRIFVSSTFYDMQVERDLLKKVVKKRLDEKFGDRGVIVEFVDLRWGLDTQSESDVEENVLRVCLREIRNCMPFFISFLGDRYGWVPDAGLKEKGCAFMGKDDYRMLCGEKNISVTEMEILYGAFRKDATLGNCVFCFRDDGSYSKLSDAERTLYGDDDVKTEKLRRLKRKILAQCEKQGDGKIINYHIDLEGDYPAKLLSLSSLADELVAWFSSKIEDMKKSDLETLPDELTRVNAFIRRHEKHYVERKGVENKILDYIVNGDNGFIVLNGESGCGKSCTLSRIYRMLGQNASFVPLFFSTEFSPVAVNATEVLKSYTRQLEHYLGQPLPRGESYNELQDVFNGAIDKVGACEKQVVLLLDAADGMQRDVVSRNLAFIPDGMAAVVSVSNGSFADYGTFHSNCHHVKMPCFSREESLALIDSIMGVTRFHLDAGQKDLLLLKKTTDGRTACESPLWTYLAMNLILNLDYFDFHAARGGEIAQGHEEGDYAAFLREVSRGNVDAVRFVKLLIENWVAD